MLTSCGMVETILHRSAYNVRTNRLRVMEKTLFSKENKPVVFIPAKLAMVAKPKLYGSDQLGINDVEFSENVLIPKHSYGSSSVINSDDNIIFDLVNNVSSVPFKINTELLDYLEYYGIDQGLLINPDEKHKYEGLDKRSEYQKGVYSSHISKLHLQETILSMANFYKKFPYIYFPVRLDQRGRLYCSPSYLNYQSSELAKALLLFGEPGIVER